MKKFFLFFILFLGFNTAWGHDAYVNGIYYNLNIYEHTASVTYRGKNYKEGANSYSGNVVIPETVSVNGIIYSVTSLKDYSFYQCSNLKSITIPNSVTSLGSLCIRECSQLTSITIPNSVTSMGNGAFWGCYRLEYIMVDSGNSVFDSRENCNAVIHTSTNKLIVGCKNSKIPNSVTSLGQWCFDGCSLLTSITIPNSVTSLENQCFYRCFSLTSITIPNSVTSMGYGCFWECSSLTSVTIPNSVTSLGVHFFDGCTNLTSIALPDSVTSLGDYCFHSCSSLASITIPNSVTGLGEGCFRECNRLTSIYMLPPTPPSVGAYLFYKTPLKTIYVVSEEAKALYQATSPWNAYEIVVMETGIDDLKVEQDAPHVIGYYDLSGRKLNGKQRGIVIERYADGTSRKVMVK